MPDAIPGFFDYPMNKDRVLTLLKKNESANRYILNITVTVLVFLLIYGVNILDVTNIDWIRASDGDPYQHYIGWLAYSMSPWSFPWGLGTGLNGSDSFSIVLTDSIPIVAFIFKLFKAVLPEQFQYFGIYGLINYALMSFFVTKICNKYKVDTVSSLIVSLIVCFNPVVLFRMYIHTGLASWWLLLWAFDILLTQRDSGKQISVSVLIQVVLMGFISVSIHTYYLLLCAFVLGIYCFYESICKHRWLYILLYPEVYVISGMFALWFWGASDISTTVKSSIEPFGFNLNSFYNPIHWGNLILPALPVCGEAQEGESYMYLGAGGLLMVILIVAFLIYRKVRHESIRFNTGLFVSMALVCFVIFIIALSNRVTFNGNVLAEFTVPETIYEIWALFRSVSRMMWVVYCLILIVGMIGLYRVAPAKIRTAVMLLVLALQIVDLFPLIMNTRDKYNHVSLPPETVCSAPVWDTIGQDPSLDTIVLISMNLDYVPDVILPVSEYAVEHDMTLNQFYFARLSYSAGKREAALETLRQRVPNCVYVFNEADMQDPEVIEAIDYSGINIYESSGCYVGLFD